MKNKKTIFSDINNQKKYILLSFLFALSIGQVAFFEENHVHLLRSLANNNYFKLNDDWLSKEIDHVPFFTFVSSQIIKYFSLIGLNILHIILSLICAISIFYICKFNLIFYLIKLNNQLFILKLLFINFYYRYFICQFFIINYLICI